MQTLVSQHLPKWLISTPYFRYGMSKSCNHSFHSHNWTKATLFLSRYSIKQDNNHIQLLSRVHDSLLSSPFVKRSNIVYVSDSLPNKYCSPSVTEYLLPHITGSLIKSFLSVINWNSLSYSSQNHSNSVYNNTETNVFRQVKLVVYMNSWHTCRSNCVYSLCVDSLLTSYLTM